MLIPEKRGCVLKLLRSKKKITIMFFHQAVLIILKFFLPSDKLFTSWKKNCNSIEQIWYLQWREKTNKTFSSNQKLIKSVCWHVLDKLLLFCFVYSVSSESKEQRRKGGNDYIVSLNVVNTATSLSQQTKTSWPFHLTLKSGGPSKMSGIIAPTSVTLSSW